jgi:predicted transcriptional regulator
MAGKRGRACQKTGNRGKAGVKPPRASGVQEGAPIFFLVPPSAQCGGYVVGVVPRLGRFQIDAIWYNVGMTKLLEKAIEKVRALPAEDQDAVAVAVLSMTEEKPVALDAETRAAIHEGLEQARRGEFVPDEEIEALWRMVYEGSLHAASA